jgi:hypothetical protein
MKQIKCVVFVRKADGKVGAITETHKPGVDDLNGDWTAVEMTGEMPDPGQCVKADSTCQVIWSDTLHRWEIVVKRDAGDRRGFATLAEALEHADKLKLHVTNRADAAQGAKILESEKVAKACEVNWQRDIERWVVVFDNGCTSSGYSHLARAVAYADEMGYRVTNDPREVVLKQNQFGAWFGEDADTGALLIGPDHLEEQRNLCEDRGWRILREEAASTESQKTCEVRWIDEYSEWHVGMPGVDALECPTFLGLDHALAAARRLGLRVTNDPREVVLKQGQAVSWWILDGAPQDMQWFVSQVAARKYAEQLGWRILREEPAEPPPVVPPIPKGIPLQESARASNTLTPEDIKAQRESWARGEAAMGSDADEARERERILGKEPAEHQHRMTLGEVLTRTDFSEPSDVETLFIRIVEAIGRDKR